MEGQWSIDPRWRPTTRVGTRPGFVDVPMLVGLGNQGTSRLKFVGRGIGVFVAAGPDTGNLEFRIDDGDWQRLELFTQWSPTLYLPWAKMLASELDPGPHEIELRVAPDSDPRSSGTAIHISHFLINR